MARLFGSLYAAVREALLTRHAWYIRPHTAGMVLLGVCLIFVGASSSRGQGMRPLAHAQSLDPAIIAIVSDKDKTDQKHPDQSQANRAATQGILTDAWIYPDAPGALTALQHTNLYVVKAEFLHVNDDGSLEQINQTAATPNGYSAANVALMKAHSSEQYITVSGDMAGTQLAMQNQQQTIDTMMALADKAGFGIEIDWEEFGQWTPDYYHSFKSFLSALSGRLHADGHKLIIDGPPISDANSQSWYQWKYEELAPLTDGVVMMIYDNQYDTGVGGSIAPRDWTAACLSWLRDKAGGRAIAGIASYGYNGDENTGRISVNTSDSIARQLTEAFGSLTATRNGDGELTARLGQTFYDYSDRQTMDMRLQEVEQSGINHLAVWSLGGNPWF